MKGFSRIFVLGLTMTLVGVAVGLSGMTTYAHPIALEDKGAPGALTFQSVCTTCHDTSRPQNYTGTATWAEVIEQMRGFGAFFTDDQAKEIETYLQETYPRSE